MRKRIWWLTALPLLLLTVGWNPSKEVSARPALSQEVTSAMQLIDAINGLRLANGRTPLSIHPILMQTAQGQADYMAATGQMTHQRPGGITYTQQLLSLGFPLAGDLSLGGLRSENILVAPMYITWNEIYGSWSDDLHMNTMLKPDYTSIGAGISQGADSYYYAVDTAAMTASGQMSNSAAAILTGVPNSKAEGEQLGISQYMVPVIRVTARPDGDVIHNVQYGQTLWSLAIAYGTTINSIRSLNNLGEETTIYQGQVLLVQKAATQPPPPTETPIPSPTSIASRTLTQEIAFPGFPTMTVQPAITMSPTTAPEPSSSSVGLWVGMLVMLAVVAGVVGALFIRPSK